MTQIRVLETAVLHSSDVAYWLDGSSAENAVDMARVPLALTLELSSRPSDLTLVNSIGKTAFLRRPTNPIINGEATENDKKMPVTATFPIAGTVSDPAGRFIPRRFSFNAGNAAGHSIVLFPTPLGTKFGKGGGLIGTLRFSNNSAPVPWALLTLAVTTAIGTTLTFKGQANGQGDFNLSMNRLPPLPEGIDHYDAQLSISALAIANADIPVDPADFVAMQLGNLTANSFANPIGLSVVPGEIRLTRSFNRDHLAVQPI